MKFLKLKLNVEIPSFVQSPVSTFIHIVIVAKTVVEYRSVEYKSHPFQQQTCFFDTNH